MQLIQFFLRCGVDRTWKLLAKTQDLLFLVQELMKQFKTDKPFQIGSGGAEFIVQLHPSVKRGLIVHDLS